MTSTPKGCYDINAKGCYDINPKGCNDINPKGCNDINAKGCYDINPKGCNDINPKGCNDINPKGRHDINTATLKRIAQSAACQRAPRAAAAGRHCMGTVRYCRVRKGTPAVGGMG
jgi:hypothetical protein